MSTFERPLRAEDFRAPEGLAGLGGKALVVGVVAAAATALGAFVDAGSFYPAYLVAWLLWFTVAAGCLGLLMMHHLSGGRWGLVLRRPLEAGARTLPVIGVLVLPLLFGLDRIFVWTDPAKVQASEVLKHKSIYLNAPFFAGRTIFAIVLFSIYAYVLSRRSAAQDREGDGGKAWAMQRISAVGFLVFVLVFSFLGFDWLMSLDPYWFSSIYGAIFLAGSAIAAMTFLILVVTYLAGREPMARVYTKKRFLDFGTLLFAMVMFFTYLSISQFIIAYQGNLPEEVVWFKERFHGYWAWVATGLLVLHFFFPFLILLSREVKGRAERLAKIAAFVLLMRWVDLVWLSRPTFVQEGNPLSWIDLAAPLGIGGLWIYFFTRELARQPLLPIGDPKIEEALGND